MQAMVLFSSLKHLTTTLTRNQSEEWRPVNVMSAKWLDRAGQVSVASEPGSGAGRPECLRYEPLSTETLTQTRTQVGTILTLCSIYLAQLYPLSTTRHISHYIILRNK